jgi:hypothetical protein
MVAGEEGRSFLRLSQLADAILMQINRVPEHDLQGTKIMEV